MASWQARALAAVLRAVRFRRLVERQFEHPGRAVSAEPGPVVAGVATVRKELVARRDTWWLEPRRPLAHRPLVLYLHGGGYVLGINRQHWSFLARLIERTGARVCAPDYPLAPAVAASGTVRWMLDLYAGLVPGGRRIVVMGDSAGAGLALALAVAVRDAGLPPPSRLVLLSPWLDVGMTAAEGPELARRDPILTRRGLLAAGRAYAGAAGVSDPRASPLFADLSGLSPTTVFTGGIDQLIADARRLAEHAASIPGWDLEVREVPGMIHDWQLFGFLPEARAVMDEVVANLG